MSMERKKRSLEEIDAYFIGKEDEFGDPVLGDGQDPTETQNEIYLLFQEMGVKPEEIPNPNVRAGYVKCLNTFRDLRITASLKREGGRARARAGGLH